MITKTLWKASIFLSSVRVALSTSHNLMGICFFVPKMKGFGQMTSKVLSVLYSNSEPLILCYIYSVVRRSLRRLKKNQSFQRNFIFIGTFFLLSYNIRKHAIKLSYLRNITKARSIFMVPQNIILDGEDRKYYYHLPDCKQNFSF